MNQQDKELLLKDLCVRLPYGVKVEFRVGDNVPDIRIFTGKDYDYLKTYHYIDEFTNCTFKPYLRPLSSMTEEERADMGEAILKDKIEPWGEIKSSGVDNLLLCSSRQASNLIDWFNRYHFDYRGLIEKGLAIEASEGMYNIN